VNRDGLDHVFSSRLDQPSILITDKSKSGIKYAESTGLAHFALDSKKLARKGWYKLQLGNSLQSTIAEIFHSGSCFTTKNAELYITWDAWKVLNSLRRLTEKKDSSRPWLYRARERPRYGR